MFEKNFALCLLRDLLRDTVAGVTTIATLALPVVVGAAGLAFDLNRGYQQRVINQRAADMAALGAAMAYRASSEESVITPVAQDIAAANGLSGAMVAATLQADFPSAGQEAILVTVSMPTPYMLASVLGFSGSFNVTAESYSSVSGGGGLTYSSCLLALDETESKAIWFNGNPTVDSPCGIAALSNASDAIRISGSPGDYNVGTVVTAGGVYDQHGGFSSATVLTGITGMVDPYAGLTLPDNPAERSLSCEPATTTFTADATTTVSVAYEYYKGQNQSKATPETATTSHYFSGFTRIFELERDAAGDRQFIDFFSGIFAREDGPIIEDIEAQMSSHDLLAHNPVVLPRDKGAILVRRLVAQRIAAEQA